MNRTKFILVLASVMFVLAVNAFSQTMVDAQVPIKVNVAASVKIEPPAGIGGEGDEGSVTANTEKPFNIKLVGETTAISPQNLANAAFNYNVSLYSIKGKQVLRSSGIVPSVNLPAGVYLLSVKGANSNSFAKKLVHGGGALNINASFGDFGNSHPILAKNAGNWTITVSANGYLTQTRNFSPVEGMNALESFTMSAQPTAGNFTETVGNIKMIYAQGGQYSFGGSRQLTVSDFYIGETEVTRAQWAAVMGGTVSNAPGMCMDFTYPPNPNACANNPVSNLTWYEANEFVCELSKKTGKLYRLPTEAEWEYAARGGKNSNGYTYSGSNTHNDVAIGGTTACSNFACATATKQSNELGIYDMSGNVEEWTYDSWVVTYNGSGTDPVMGTNSHIHTQKARRGGYYGEGDDSRVVTSRRLRSVEGSDPTLGFRIALSGDAGTVPPNMRVPCNIKWPHANDGEVKNGWRDMRWVTGSDSMWQVSSAGSAGMGNTLRIWADGTALNGNTAGQWYTVNNMVLKFVPNSGSSRARFPYIFVDLEEPLATIISGGNSILRIQKVPTTGSFTKPTATGTQPKDLATDAEDVMIDFANIPVAHQKKDPLLIQGSGQLWWLNGAMAGGAHSYVKNVTDNTFQFYVYMPGTTTLLAGGASGSSWFTVNNTFLRVKSSSGYTTDYIYTANANTFIHVSYQMYERGDFRTFQKTASGSVTGNPSSIPAESAYDGHKHGYSTFEPPLPPDGGY